MEIHVFTSGFCYTGGQMQRQGITALGKSRNQFARADCDEAMPGYFGTAGKKYEDYRSDRDKRKDHDLSYYTGYFTGERVQSFLQ